MIWRATTTGRPRADYAEADDAVQRLIDRLLFLRHCEDRGITEPDLRSLLHRINDRGTRHVRVTQSLLRLFGDAANTFDSEIFQTDAVIDVQFRALADITDFDDTLAEVVKGLYAVPLSLAEYDFSQMDADILGQVYEQYLGHVAQQTRKFAASQPELPGMPAPGITVEAKRQRRRERGIYYTPAWVVRYIVDQTVGRFLDENGQRPDAIANLTILDPACGSGSFLIRGYETLLDYYAGQMGGEIPDTATRHRILRDHIYGVDLDPQAVEIARLNLLLRMVRRQELLPELKDNIQHGNSLIEGDEAALRRFFGDAWEEKHPFNWAQRFPKVMERGGFDIIIGNPPYVGFHGFEEDKPYLRDTYETAQGRFDLYIPFVERAHRLLKPGGLFAFICPTNFMKREHGRKLRDLLRAETAILTIHDFQDLQAFEGPLNYTGILVFRKSPPESKHFLAYSYGELNGAGYRVDQSELGSGTWIFRDPKSEKIVSRALAAPVETLGQLAQGISEGIVTGKNDVFLLTADDVNSHGIESEIIRKAVRGRQVKRYSLEWDGTQIVYPYHLMAGKTSALPETGMKTRFPKAYKYLAGKRGNLSGRGYFDRSPKVWYELWCERDLGQQATVKVLTPELADSNKFAIAPQDRFYLDTVCGITLKPQCGESLFYLLGLLNSALIQYIYRQTTVPKANGFLIYKTMYLKDIPIRRIAFDDSEESHTHDRLVALVHRMLDLHGRLAAKGEMQDNEREQIDREIAITDRQIDGLVYDLYGLTAKERALVESEIRRA